MSDDSLFCPDCETKLKVMQGASFVHEHLLCYWRRKKCLTCGYMMKTVEVPAASVHTIINEPDDKVMA